MMKLFAIARNTFVQTIRQPIYGVLVFMTILILVLECPIANWTLGNGQAEYDKTDQQFLVQLGLGMLLFSGLLLAAFCASSALTREIEDNTALTVISKPLSRSTFILGKFAGVAGAITVAFYLAVLVFLMTVRHKVVSNASDPIDPPVIVFGLSALALGLIIAISGNIFFNWPFISASVTSLAVTMSIAMGIIMFVGKDWTAVPPGYDIQPRVLRQQVKAELKPGYPVNDFRTTAQSHGMRVETTNNQLNLAVVQLPISATQTEAAKEIKTWPGVEDTTIYDTEPVIDGQLVLSIVLVFLAVLVLVAVAIAAGTRFGQVLTLLICMGVLLAGTYHSWLLGQWTSKIVLVKLAGPLVPKMTYFFMLDALALYKHIPLSYVGLTALYSGLYISAILALGVVLFQKRSLEADSGTASVPAAVNLLAGLGRMVAFVAGLVALEGLLSCLFGRFDKSFEPIVFNALALAGGGNSVLAGLLMCVSLALLAVVSYMLWTYFGRAKRWAFFVVILLAIPALLVAAAAAIYPSILRLPSRPDGAVTAAVLAGLVMLVLILPSTRRHFQKVKPLNVNL
jgi:ABC-type transport system involved in multi-copper enzyme maturation permease subunit